MIEIDSLGTFKTPGSGGSKAPGSGGGNKGPGSGGGKAA